MTHEKKVQVYLLFEWDIKEEIMNALEQRNIKGLAI